MKEAISKFTIFGSEYVKLEDLNEFIRDMQRKTREGKEPGYMNQTKEQRIAVDVTLGHLRVILNKERNFDGILCKLMKTRFEREAAENKLENLRDAKEAAEAAMDQAREAIDHAETLLNEDEEEEKPGSWMVYKPGKQRGDFWIFREWDNGDAVIGKDGGMVFTYEGMAQHVADKLGAGWVVIDVSQESVKRAERLLAAIFRDDEPEYHGDGTKAEDEDWDEE